MKLPKILKIGNDKLEREKLSEDFKQLQLTLDDARKLIKNQELDLEAESEKSRKLELENEELKKSSYQRVLDVPIVKGSINCMLRFLKDSRKSYQEKIMGSEADRICFVHLDGDGLCSAALFKRHFGNESIKIYCINQDNRDLIPTVRPKKEILAADIVLNKDLADYFLKLSQQNVKVTFIDHHRDSTKIPEETLSHLRSEGALVLEHAKSAASLVARHFGLNDEVSQRVVLIAERSDGDRSEKTSSFIEDDITINRLARLDESTIDKSINELARYGMIVSKGLKESKAMADLLLIYSSQLIKKRLFHQTNYFQAYCLNKDDTPLIGISMVGSEISLQNKKDVYVFFRKNGEMIVKGTTKRIRADNVFPNIARELDGRSYGGRMFGGCSFPCGDGKIEKAMTILDGLYENHALTKDAYGVISQ